MFESVRVLLCNRCSYTADMIILINVSSTHDRGLNKIIFFKIYILESYQIFFKFGLTNTRSLITTDRHSALSSSALQWPAWRCRSCCALGTTRRAAACLLAVPCIAIVTCFIHCSMLELMLQLGVYICCSIHLLRAVPWVLHHSKHLRRLISTF